MKEKIALFVVLFLLSVHFAHIAGAELYVNIHSSDIEYKPGETVEITAYIGNRFPNAMDIIMERTLIYPDDAETFSPIETTEVHLEPGEQKDFLYFFNVMNAMPSGTYTLNVIIKERDGEILVERSYEFNITDTLKTFNNLYFTFCLNRECSGPLSTYSDTFVLGNSPIYIKAFESEDASLSGELILPDSSISPLVFRDKVTDVRFSVTGAYKAIITASKNGYQDYIKEMEFNVIENDAVAENLFPQSSDLSLTTDYIQYLLVIISVAIVIAIIYIKKHKTHTGKGWEELEKKLRSGG